MTSSVERPRLERGSSDKDDTVYPHTVPHCSARLLCWIPAPEAEPVAGIRARKMTRRGMATYRVLLPAAAASLAPDPPARPSCAVKPAKAEEGAQRLHAAAYSHTQLRGRLKRRLFPGSPISASLRSSAELMELIPTWCQSLEKSLSLVHYSCQGKKL